MCPRPSSSQASEKPRPPSALLLPFFVGRVAHAWEGGRNLGRAWAVVFPSREEGICPWETLVSWPCRRCRLEVFALHCKNEDPGARRALRERERERDNPSNYVVWTAIRHSRSSFLKALSVHHLQARHPMRVNRVVRARKTFKWDKTKQNICGIQTENMAQEPSLLCRLVSKLLSHDYVATGWL